MTVPATTPAPLGCWPTPLEPAPRLAVELGLHPGDLWLKRDDLTGLGGGGNKVRKLEWTCGEALAAGATTLVTCGAAQSNHARLTAAAAARLGLGAVLVLAGDADAAAPGGNIALNGLFGARVVWSGACPPQQRMPEVAEELRRRGEVPAVVPFGGSSPLGAIGYATCARELLDQAPDLRTVVVALGSGGTMAGLVSVLGPDRVLGVHTGAVPDPAATVADLLAGMGRPVASGALRVRADQVGAGYPVQTDAVADAMAAAARTEGVVLDPVYTGRALAGLRAAVRDGDIAPGDRTVFLHTGGLPGLFGHPAALRRSAEGLAAFG